MSDIFCENDLWKIEIIRPGLIPNPILQRAKGKFGFFDKEASCYIPLAIYNGSDKINLCLPQGTLLDWRDKCIRMFENRILYNRYIKMYNNMKEDIH